MTIVSALGFTYYHARVLNDDGSVEDLFLTENELVRLRERAAKKDALDIYARPVPGWKRFLLRLLGVV
jgi:hypothetical protein